MVQVKRRLRGGGRAGRGRRRADRFGRRRRGWRRPRPTSWSSFTTQPTSSATSPRRSPNTSQRSTPMRKTKPTPEADEEADDGQATGRVRRGRRQALIWREAARRGAARNSRIPARQWLQTYSAPWLASSAKAGQFVPSVRPVRPRPAPALQPEYVRSAVRPGDDPLPHNRPWHRVAGGCGRRRGRDAGPRSAVRSRPQDAPHAARRRWPGHGRRALAG